MGLLSLVFVAALVACGPLFAGEKRVATARHQSQEFQGPCQPFQANQTKLCSEFQTLVQENGPKAVCNLSDASCYVNVNRRRPSRTDFIWGKCYCDSLCQQIGDCCVDYDMWNPVSSTRNDTEGEKLICRRCPTNQRFVSPIMGYVMIGRCPPSWRNTETERACLSTDYVADPAVILPLLDVTTNDTYANIYCAICNGKSRDLHHWSLGMFKLQRPDNISLLDITSPDVLWEAFPFRDITPDKCIVTHLEAITEPETKLKRLCRSYANTIFLGLAPEFHFKNPHCALLSNANLLQNRAVLCGLFSRVPPKFSSMVFVFSGANSDPDSSHGANRTVHVKYHCGINEVYEPFRERCLSVHFSHSNNHSTNATHKCNGLRFSLQECRMFTNNSVFIIPHQKLYNNESYLLVNQTLILCANFSRNYTRKSTTPHAEHESPARSSSHLLALRIVTYVGLSLSIISLLILLVTYFLFAELRTYPGKKVMHLSCAMIAMQAVYFFSDPDVVPTAVCAVMGALLHFFILVMFLWMSTIAHSTQKTFSNLNVDLHNSLVIAKRKKSYIYSCVFSWGLPLVIVGICVTLQLTNTGNVAYGNEDGCQLSLPARMYALAIPVSTLLGFNIGALIRTAVAIKQLGNMHMTAANQISLPIIVLKLTVVMGITWILGFVLAFYPTPYLEYPFVIINSCQGVLMCISFVFNKHVYNLYKQRFTNTTDPEPAVHEADLQQAGAPQQP